MYIFLFRYVKKNIDYNVVKKINNFIFWRHFLLRVIYHIIVI